MSKKLTSISLFTGAQGLDLGIEKAGFHIGSCVEIDPTFCKTIGLNSDVPVINKDIKDVTGDEILKAAGYRKGSVDLVFGGPPCQPFSTAGKRRGLDDFRANTIVGFLRIVKEIRPKAILFENVRGIMSSKLNYVPDEYNGRYKKYLDKKGSVLFFVSEEFKELGYKITFSLFNSALYGVPQVRERFLIFGSRMEPVPLPTPTHSSDPQSILAPLKTIREAFEGLPTDPAKHTYVEFSERIKKYLRLLKAGQNWRDLPKDIQPEAMGQSYHLGGGKTGFYRRLSWDKPSPTLVTSPTMPATLLAHPEELRPLSIQEYRRIQEFPDSWKFSGGIQSQYKQIGNAVPVQLAYHAGIALRNNLEGIKSEPHVETLKFSRYNRTDHQSFYEGFLGHKRDQVSFIE